MSGAEAVPAGATREVRWRSSRAALAGRGRVELRARRVDADVVRSAAADAAGVLRVWWSGE